MRLMDLFGSQDIIFLQNDLKYFEDYTWLLLILLKY